MNDGIFHPYGLFWRLDEIIRMIGSQERRLEQLVKLAESKNIATADAPHDKRKQTTRNPSPNSEMMAVDEVCAFFGGTKPIAEQTVYRWVRIGRLPKPVKIGRLSRWRRKDCERTREAMGE